MNWWLISCIASAVFALIILFVLGAFWLADRADDLADYERQLAEGDRRLAEILTAQNIAERDRASFHIVSDPTR